MNLLIIDFSTSSLVSFSNQKLSVEIKSYLSIKSFFRQRKLINKIFPSNEFRCTKYGPILYTDFT